MPKFNWEAKTKAGAQQKGVMEAGNESMVEAQLKKYGFSAITIKSDKAGFKMPGFGGGGGKVDTKASFMADLLDGKSDFATIAISDQTVTVVDGNVAIVRHTLAADTNDSGKPGKVTIKVLGVWQKQGDQWKLLVRQAIRPPA